MNMEGKQSASSRIPHPFPLSTLPSTQAPHAPALAGLAIDQEYMNMIMELDLLTPQERAAVVAGVGADADAVAARERPDAATPSDSLL